MTSTDSAENSLDSSLFSKTGYIYLSELEYGSIKTKGENADHDSH